MTTVFRGFWTQLVILAFIIIPKLVKSEGISIHSSKLVDTDTRRGYPDPKSFHADHGRARAPKPLLMKAAEVSPLTKLPDSALALLPHAFVTFLEVGNRQDAAVKSSVTLRKFLMSYSNEDSFVDDQIPSVVKTQLVHPKFLQCEALTQTLSKTRIQLRRGDWSDPFKLNSEMHTVSCLLDGKADVIMMDTRKFQKWSELMDLDNGTLSSFGIDHESFQSLTQHQQVKLKTGDCLFIPKKWIFKSSTQDRALLVSILWKPSKKTPSCNEKYDPTMTLEKLHFNDEKKENIFQMISLHLMTEFIENFMLKANMTKEKFIREFKKEPKLKGIQNWDSECQETIEELFLAMDQNKDQILSHEDLDMTEQREGMLHLAGVYEDRMADLKDIMQDQEEEFRKKDKSPMGLVSGIKKDYEKELNQVLEDGFNEIFQELNLQGSVKFGKDGKPEISMKESSAEKPKTKVETETESKGSKKAAEAVTDEGVAEEIIAEEEETTDEIKSPTDRDEL